MKEYDLVELTADREKYKKYGVNKGDEGIILLGERDGYYLVSFHDEVFQNENGEWDTNEVTLAIPEEDMKVIPHYTK